MEKCDMGKIKELAVDLHNKINCERLIPFADLTNGSDIKTDIEKLVRKFDDVQANGYTIDKETQLYVAQYAPLAFQYIKVKDNDAIRYAFGNWNSSNYYGKKITESLSINDINTLDKDLVIELLCRIDIYSVAISTPQVMVRELILKIMKLPIFDQFTDDDKIKILQHNARMLPYLGSNNSLYQRAALQDEKGMYSPNKLFSLPTSVTLNPDVVALVLIHYEKFLLLPYTFRNLIDKRSDEELDYIIEKVYSGSIEAGLRWFPATYWLFKQNGVKMYNNIYNNLLTKDQQQTTESKKLEFSKKEIEFINLLSCVPSFSKSNIIDTIALSPSILNNQEFAQFLNKHYVFKDLEEIYSDAVLQNREVLHYGQNAPHFQIKEGILLFMIRNHPFDIAYISNPSLELCNVAFATDRGTYRYVFKQLGHKAIVDALEYDPSNIQYVTEMKIFDRLIYNYAVNIARKRNDILAESYCEDYMKELIMSEKEQEREQTKIKMRKDEVEKAVRLKEWLNLRNILLGISHQSKAKLVKKI